MMQTSSVVSPISEVDVHGRAAMRSSGRKMSSTGGNRSWSEEEETYLLQTRLQKMPYKHIAARLKKTELACRLHYHQLSHGSHRRKRTASVSSSASSTVSSGSSVSYGQYPSSEATEYGTRSPSRQESPSSLGSTSPVQGFCSVNGSPHRGVAHSSHHKMLLPKPSQQSQQGTPEPSTEQFQLPALHNQSLRINTSDSILHGPQPHDKPGPVDTDRLRAIYEAHRTSFWSVIAAEYGPDVSPAHLESIWHSTTSNHTLHRLPTPDFSPRAEPLSKFPTSHPHPAQFPTPSTTTSSAKSVFPHLYPPISFSASADRPTGLYHCAPHLSRDGNLLCSAVSPDRAGYTLPPPTPSLRSRAGSCASSIAGSNGSATQSRASTWGSAVGSPERRDGESGAPRTAIASLLTEDRCPRGSQDEGMKE
ncbi:hypothetical protein P152DRAFT_107819 [Eremomyces bilateralis CBS 781.70]|uniref:Myb-like domain-containing protein n=1 Tax=Eremomyces bilateralis CBS 781.70 TaxID=1392243 RepID=A0A6G1GD82_9PEZI|nr:uncharacterized protein P152DRAFT_107819 [Eremomyces bilateralis CBS 781.70]KAF1816018.1 hypothetical protein P152DRAFT_107819 [Eremomyces bilateralis CBS 781.70]